MSLHTNESLAMVEFEQASNTAGELAERIAECGRSRGSNADMMQLLKAWQSARHQARESHERMLTRKAVIGAAVLKRMANG